jgi:hypothetical protein
MPGGTLFVAAYLGRRDDSSHQLYEKKRKYQLAVQSVAHLNICVPKIVALE